MEKYNLPDLKPENILLDSNGHIKLADFGLSKEYELQTEEKHDSKKKVAYSFVGTAEYLAPEIVTRSGHDRNVDWWSMGALLYEMLTSLPPWYSEDRKRLFQGIMRSKLRFPKIVSLKAQSILTSLLNRNPGHRLGTNGVEEIKDHVFFAGVDWQDVYNRNIDPPYKPSFEGDKWSGENPDTNNFDTCFTEMPLYSQPQSQTAATRSTPKEKIKSEGQINELVNNFKDFTFVAQSAVSTLMEESDQENEEVEMEDKELDAVVIEEPVKQEGLKVQSRKRPLSSNYARCFNEKLSETVS